MKNLSIELPLSGATTIINIRINTTVEGHSLQRISKYSNMKETIKRVGYKPSFAELKRFYSI